MFLPLITGMVTPPVAALARAAVDVWNPADHTNSNLSAANKVATGNNATDGLARSIQSKSTGKWYFEGVGSWSSVNSSMGMCTSVVTTAGNLGGPAPDGGFAINKNANVFYNNAILFTLTGFDVTRMPFAVDLDAKLFWIRGGAAGNWNASGTANPATGTLGRSFSTTNLPLFVACGVANVDSTTFISAMSFAGTIPSGFAPWG